MLNVLAWSVVGLWLAAFFWTRYCLKKQIPLVPKSATIENAPTVSIIVPARNEARRVLEKSVSSMMAQNYQNYELIILDDRSTDDTKEILVNLFRTAEIRNSKFKIVDGADLPADWLGKPHALQQAFENAGGEWILATDADIIFAPGALATVVSYAETNKFDALTLVPRLILKSFWETLFIPVFGWFCLLAMPLHRVNDQRRKESIGMGNFFMLRRNVLEKIGGFERVKAEVAEDLKLAEILKKQRFNLRVDYAPDLIETRMYSGFWEIWEGFTKNLFSGMKFSLSKTIFSVVSITLFGVLPIFLALLSLANGSFELFIPLFVVYLLQVSAFALVHRKWQGNVIYALFAPTGLALFLAILINSTVRILSGRGVTWKGRAIYESRKLRPPL